MVSPLFHVALYEPKIPPNTGNIGRLCCAMGARLHLIEPLGFSTSDKACRRAGLDYWPHLDWRRHADYAAFRADLGERRLFALSTRGEQVYSEVRYQPGDAFLFGDELKGLPDEVFSQLIGLRIPLRSEHVRSFNLANATAIVLSEAVRQLGHPDEVRKLPGERARGEGACRSS
ncbi:MAG TPA: tRNA (uridine(34)/cytosine(34)/5-carboxymethylaminomethyluridine(34)-2'-O)-methyltransferase TrmL [Planctomycetes bacterium]|nr:tRNA (uridine(34)/cytosine(34)/5-carboxymethylaminomethyluridine(34)-2'-O)-methyltransferase TrmL [Planctomycetota bacterium]|tara:strand:+ start:95 stop:616 length:522 start_codon:yes stop_codon:yes gene_type:complete